MRCCFFPFLADMNSPGGLCRSHGQAKDLIETIGQDSKEGIMLQGRIDDCEVAASIISPGVLKLPRREVNLSIKRMVRSKCSMPPQVLLQITQRAVVDLCQDLKEVGKQESAKVPSLITQIVDRLSVWKGYPASDSEKQFTPLNPSYAELVSVFMDEVSPVCNADVPADELAAKADDMWKAKGFHHIVAGRSHRS